jgi:signal transduction histidine kinase
MTGQGLRHWWTSRVRQLSATHPYVVDGTIALFVAIPMCVPFVTAKPGGVTLLGGLLNAFTVLPLIWRRRFPFAVTLLVAGFATLVSLYDRPGQAIQYAGLVAIYTIAERGKPWQRWVFFWAIVLTFPPATLWLKHNDANEAMFTVLLPITAFLLGKLVRTARGRAEALEEYARELERSKAADEARVTLAERARIARDMHDILAHAVSLMVVQAESGLTVVRTDPDRAELAFQNIADTGRDAAAQLRRVLGLLEAGPRPLQLAPRPGVAALPDLAAHAGRSGLQVEVRSLGVARTLSPDLDTAAYRIVQESLTNTIKHAVAATSAIVQFDWWPRGLMVTVTDNGQVLPAAGTAGSAHGHGLVGIRERAISYGGHAEAGPTPDGGFRVTAWLPYLTEHDAASTSPAAEELAATEAH